MAMWRRTMLSCSKNCCVSLLFVWGTGSITVAQSPLVSLKPLDFSGIQIIRATDPSVQPLVASALGSTPSPGLVSLLPYSVILKNDTSRTIIAYTLRVTFVDAAGRSGGRTRQFFNLEATSNGMEIPRGAAHLVNALMSRRANRVPPLAGKSSTNGGTGPAFGFDEATDLSQLLSSKAAVAIAVDLIVFDTGKVIGPNDGNTLAYLRAWVMAEREIASVVRDALNRGTTIQSIIEQLEQLVAQFDTAITSARAHDQRARAMQARHFLRLAAESSGNTLALQNEINRVLAKPTFMFYQ